MTLKMRKLFTGSLFFVCLFFCLAFAQARNCCEELPPANTPVNLDVLVSVAGNAPAVSSCGTTPAIIGNDTAGVVTVGGGGAVTACTLTFVAAFTNEPACVITPQANVTSYISASATSAVTVTFSADVQSQKFNYACIGL